MSGVEDHGVEPAGLRNEVRHLCGIAQVGDEDLASDGGLHIAQGFDIASRKHDAGTPAGQGAGDTATETAAGTSDEDPRTRDVHGGAP